MEGRGGEREGKPVTNKVESFYETATDDGLVKDQLLGLAVNQVIWGNISYY